MLQAVDLRGMSSGDPIVQFLRLGSGLRLAYATHGSGPHLICPAWWVSHLEKDWRDAGFRALFGGLARHFTVVRYDRLGSGLSDRSREQVDIEDEIGALTELSDHLALERFSVFAVSCAAPPAIGYAARHPERIDRLVFFGSFVRGCDVGPPQIKEAIQSLVRAHWGLGSRTMTNLFAPNLSPEDVKRVSRQQRSAASPEMAAQLLALTFDVDAADDAAAVSAPALVLHRRGDLTVRHAAGRELAASLPNARFRTLEGSAHVPWVGDVAEVRDAVVEFLGGGAIEAVEEQTEAPAGNALRRAGDVWTLTFEGRSVHLKDARGLADLAVLLANPGAEIHAEALSSGGAAHPRAPAAPVLDDEALASYRARLRELEEAIDEAQERGLAEAAERYREERDILTREICNAVGLGGRKRGLNDAAERARKAVSARIRASIKKISALHPELGAHLDANVSTGIFCSYDPPGEIEWSVSEAPPDSI